MNVKLEEQKVAFKITEAELQKLLDGEGLNVSHQLGCHYGIKVSHDEEFSFKVDSGLTLTISDSLLAELQSMGRHRDGISTVQNGVKVVLQVDIRTDTRAKKKS